MVQEAGTFGRRVAGLSAEQQNPISSHTMAVLMISAVAIGLVAVVPLFRNQSTVAAWLATIGLLLMIGVRKGVRVRVPLAPPCQSWFRRLR